MTVALFQLLKRHARQLMEETIVRNASPVRSMESTATVGETNAGAAGDAAGGAIEDDNYEGRRGRVSQSVVDAALNEFRYSVNVGQQTITITGHNLDLVRVPFPPNPIFKNQCHFLKSCCLILIIVSISSGGQVGFGRVFFRCAGRPAHPDDQHQQVGCPLQH